MPYLHLTDTEVVILLDGIGRLTGYPTAELQALADKLNPSDEDIERHADIRHLARRHAERQGHEIDDDAIVSEGDDNGAYVMAWVWVDFEGTDLDKEI